MMNLTSANQAMKKHSRGGPGREPERRKVSRGFGRWEFSINEKGLSWICSYVSSKVHQLGKYRKVVFVLVHDFCHPPFIPFPAKTPSSWFSIFVPAFVRRNVKNHSPESESVHRGLDNIDLLSKSKWLECRLPQASHVTIPPCATSPAEIDSFHVVRLMWGINNRFHRSFREIPSSKRLRLDSFPSEGSIGDIGDARCVNESQHLCLGGGDYAGFLTCWPSNRAGNRAKGLVEVLYVLT